MEVILTHRGTIRRKLSLFYDLLKMGTDVSTWGEVGYPVPQKRHLKKVKKTNLQMDLLGTGLTTPCHDCTSVVI